LFPIAEVTRMKNALSVFTAKAAITGRTFANVAQQHGIQIRFMALGGYLPSNLSEIQNKPLATVNGGGLLVIGAFEADIQAIDEFDKLVDLGDRSPIAAMLTGGQLPWCELYTSRFSYEQSSKANANQKPKTNDSVPTSVLKRAKTRYIIYNQSRRKNSQQLMISIADALGNHTDGVVADCQRPPR
jgi:hypothetical protein